MVTVHDPLTEELQRSHLRLNDELIFSPQKYGDEIFVHIEVPSTSQFFRIGFAEYVFISQFDGETSSATALAVTAQSQGTDAINEKKSRDVIDWLLENGLAGFAGDNAGINASNTQNKQMPWYSKLNPFWMKLPLGNPSQLLDAALPMCQWMFHPITVLVSTLFIFAGAISSLAYRSEIFGGFQVWDSNNWIWLLVSWVVLKIVHEFAHAITCRHFGGKVPETGLIFILFAPLAYVNVTSSWRFSSRWKRIAVAAAGMYLEMIIASVCIFVLLNTDSPVVHDILVNAVVMAGVATLLFNANPLMKFDGYFMLSDLLKIPNLFENGNKSFRQTMTWVFLGEKQTAGCHEIRKNRIVTTVYGWLASIWKILICVGMTIAASSMFGGFGILLAFMGMFSWFGKPTYEMLKRLSIHFKRRPSSSLRIGAIVGLVGMLLAASWFWIPSPFCVRAPCLVEFEDAAKVRAQTTGFVAEVLVEEGAMVEIGQPLIRIENRELSSEVKQLRAELKYEQTRERIAIDKPDPAEAQVAVRQQKAIETSLYSRENELEDLMIKAPCRGQVVARDLASMTGKYLQQGDIILLISDETVKEVTVSLPVTELHSAKNLVGASIPLEIGSRRKLYATIKQISPRATTQVSHESLIVPNGGPITVRASETDDESSSEYEYCEPRLSLVGTLDASDAKTLWSGERGFAVLSSNTPTLGKWGYLSVQNWLKNQLEFATPPATQ